jgi:hypothetical protein
MCKYADERKCADVQISNVQMKSHLMYRYVDLMLLLNPRI